MMANENGTYRGYLSIIFQLARSFFPVGATFLGSFDAFVLLRFLDSSFALFRKSLISDSVEARETSVSRAAGVSSFFFLPKSFNLIHFRSSGTAGLSQTPSKL